MKIGIGKDPTRILARAFAVVRHLAYGAEAADRSFERAKNAWWQQDVLGRFDRNILEHRTKYHLGLKSQVNFLKW